jgi:ATP-dependent RNA helicase DDX31/DBP7
LRKGVTVLVCTPGRLLDHLQTTASFNVSNLSYVVFDEADRLMDMGFEASITEIYNILASKIPRRFSHNQVRCIMLSATLKAQVEGLASRVLTNPLYLAVSHNEDEAKESADGVRSDSKAIALPETLQHGVIEVDYTKKINALLGFLNWKMKTQEDLKAIIFMTACAEVEFYYTLMLEAGLFKDGELHMLHGSLPQVDRTQIFLRFCSAKSGILICTNVAARGLDLPEIDWSIQYDAPEDVSEYVHRAGRTARKGRKGRGLLFLSPNKEIGFANVLGEHGIELRRVESEPLLRLAYESMNKCLSIMVADKEVEAKANAAFIAFVRGYSTYPKHLKSFFHPKNLHLGHVAKSFLLRNPPSTIAKMFNKERSSNALSVKEASKIKNPEFAKGAMKLVNRGKKPLNTKIDALAEFMC